MYRIIIRETDISIFIYKPASLKIDCSTMLQCIFYLCKIGADS